MGGVQIMKKLLISLLAIFISLIVVDTSSSKTVWTAKDTVVVYNEIVYEDALIMMNGISQLSGITHLRIVITSGGGSLYGCQLMLEAINRLKASGVKVTTEVVGVAYSAAAILFLSGDERIMHVDSELMFHEGGIYDKDGNDITESAIDNNPRIGVRLQ